jgi:hypothetical protein
MLMDLLERDLKSAGSLNKSSHPEDHTTPETVLFRSSNRTVLKLNLKHMMRMLDVILKIAPPELRSPGGNIDFLMELYEMRQQVSAAIKKEGAAGDKKLFKELQDIESANGSHVTGSQSLVD